MDELINIAVGLYECLSRDSRVSSPGSIRSYVYALADYSVRAQMGADDDLLLRVLAQNLRGSVRVREGELKDILRDALICLEGGPREVVRIPAAAHGLDVDTDASPNLAIIINKYIDKYSSPKDKYIIIKKLFGEKKLEELHNNTIKIERRLEEAEELKISVSSLRRYRPGHPYSDVDILLTSMNFTRKSILGKPISNLDIILREYKKKTIKNIIICLDVSGSMKEYVRGATKLQLALGAIAHYIDFLRRENADVALILFNAQADVLWAPYPAAKYAEYMKAILPYVFPTGGTDLASAFRLLIEEDLGGEIVLVSDGRTANAEAAVEYVKRIKGRIHVFAAEDSAVLKRIAGAKGGVYSLLA